jgi:hypothetical protein
MRTEASLEGTPHRLRDAVEADDGHSDKISAEPKRLWF